MLIQHYKYLTYAKLLSFLYYNIKLLITFKINKNLSTLENCLNISLLNSKYIKFYACLLIPCYIKLFGNSATRKLWSICTWGILWQLPQTPCFKGATRRTTHQAYFRMLECLMSVLYSYWGKFIIDNTTIILLCCCKL